MIVTSRFQVNPQPPRKYPIMDALARISLEKKIKNRHSSVILLEIQSVL